MMKKIVLLLLVAITCSCGTKRHYGDVKIEGDLKFEKYIGGGSLYIYSTPNDLLGYTQACLVEANSRLVENHFAKWSYKGADVVEVIYAKGNSVATWSQEQAIGNNLELRYTSRMGVVPDRIIVKKKGKTIFETPLFSSDGIYNGTIATDIYNRIKEVLGLMSNRFYIY
ncbi:hypothetical protein K5X82_00300 [Halosquirtibacter xylanolyticus]|uniref:hypothetical protein n=1 Tax=Halosquirtibacter xylanolyticus TaxID=3374599 RepID=UPI0037492065|nr:hypothetical protein K5X82_00300 [Prolixibacteraceae bacterium]